MFTKHNTIKTFNCERYTQKKTTKKRDYQKWNFAWYAYDRVIFFSPGVHTLFLSSFSFSFLFFVKLMFHIVKCSMICTYLFDSFANRVREELYKKSEWFLSAYSIIRV